MAKHVIILGAGASCEAGAPLMLDFLDKAEDLLGKRGAEVDRPSFELVFEAIDELQKVHSKSSLDINNIETVFSAFELADLFGRLGELDSEKVSKLLPAIRKLIVETLEQSIVFRFDENRMLNAPPAYRNLCNSVSSAIERDATSVAIITFNYDVILDWALDRENLTPNYCLTEGNRHDRSVDVMKLHGSLHWWKLKSGEPHPGDISLLKQALPPRENRFGESLKEGKILVSREIAKGTRIQGEETDGEPFIVPPTWAKVGEYKALQPVWKAAAKHLSEAKNIFVVGYSLPVTDEFFKYLYGLGTLGPSRIRRFCVIDPASEVEGRFRNLLGLAVQDRFEPHAGKFGEKVAVITGVLDRDT